MTLEMLHIDKICRTCLSEENVVRSVFTMDENNGETTTLFEMLLSYTSVQISDNDGLPSQVCEQCVHYINKAYSFKQLCERSDETLRQVLGKNYTENFLDDMKSAGHSAIRNNVLETLKVLVPNQVTDSSLSSSIALKVTSTNLNEVQVTPDIMDIKFLDNYEAVDNTVDLDDNLVDNFENNGTLGKVDGKNQFSHSFDSSNSIENLKKLSCNIEDRRNAFLTKCNSNSNSDQIVVNFEVNLKDQTDLNMKQEGCSVTEPKKTAQNDDCINPEHSCNVTDQQVFSCDLCTSSFTSQDDLSNHLKSKKIHICQTCKKVFSSASTLCRHMKVHDGSKKHLCNECGKGFSRSDDLTRHLRTHTGEKPYECKICSKSFSQSFRLLEHMRAHANEKSFKCRTCGKAFSRYSSFAAHSRTHLNIKTHVCNICDKRLCGSGSLAMHMKTHTGLRDHVCPFCGKGFTTTSNLIIHKRTHTGERPYVCATCGKAFPEPSRLTVHLRSHTGEKPYVCQYCNHGCVSSSQLKKHVRIHTGEKPYKCNICPKAFPRSEDLRTHVKTHIGYRDYICIYCSKGFYQASTLKVHLRIHTGEKPYKCSVCSKSFSQTGPLSTHMKTHNA